MTTDPHDLLAAYALDAVDDAERERFVEHLAHCPECSEELAGFRETSALLGAASQSTAPPGLRAKVLDAASRTPQQPPAPVPTVRQRRIRRLVTRSGLAAALVAVIVSVGVAVTEHNRAQDLDRRQQAVSAVLSAPDAQMTTDKTSSGGRIRLVRSADLGKAVLVTRGLKKLDADHDYQMWTIAGGTPASAGVLPGQQQMAAHSHLMTDVSKVSVVAITVEPAGGSKQPTTKPIAAVKLS